MRTDLRSSAEDFIEKVVVPRRMPPRTDPKAERARDEQDRKDIELARCELAASGIDVDRLDRLGAERSKLRKERVEETRRNAVAASVAAAQRLKDLTLFVPPIEPVESVIEQMTFIRSFLGQGLVSDSNIGVRDNWAKYRVESGDPWEGTGRLSFFALWRNERNAPTILTARPNLIVNAHLSSDADGLWVGSWFSAYDTDARATVRARTTVWSMDSSVSAITHDQILAHTGASGGFFGDDHGTGIEFNEILSATGVTVAPNSFALIEVELLSEWFARGGYVVLDAQDGERRVEVPQILITELRQPEPAIPPPISLTVGVDTSTNPANVVLVWTGANGALVDIYQNGARLGDTENDGTWIFPINPGTHTFRVCEAQSTTVCSAQVSVIVP